jgi:hypothetical protein
MNVPPPIPGESPKAHNAFKVYCDVDGHITQVAKRLQCSLQNITKWQRKFDWKKRFERQRQAECSSKIQAQERATEAIATISEAEKASVWRAAFVLAARFIRRANEIANIQPHAAATLTKTAFSIIESVKGGVAGGFQVNVGVINAAEKQFPSLAFDDAGKPVKEVDFIRSYEQALKVLDAGEIAALPCDNWSPNSIDATPVFTKPEPDVAQMSNSKPEKTVPSRMAAEECPTSDGVGPAEVSQTKGTLPFYLMLDDAY